MLYLTKSVAQNIMLGPFLSPTDFTPVTGLSIAAADIKISKQGLAFDVKHEGSAGTHDSNGYYRTALDETDTNFSGRLIVEVTKTGAIPVKQEYMILPVQVYNSLIGGSGLLDVNVYELESNILVDISEEVATALGQGSDPEDPTLGGQLTSILADTAQIQPEVNALYQDRGPNAIVANATYQDAHELLTDWEDGGRLDLLLDVASGSGSGGGGLGLIAYVGSVSKKAKVYDIVQGEQRAVTILVEAESNFADTTPTSISVVIEDDAGNLVTKNNASITRVLEDSKFQVIRFTLSTADTESLSSGYAKVEISFDNEKALVKNAIRIVEGL